MGKKIELPEVEPVHLKPFHGIRPGVIILAVLLLIALSLFFIICMLPGILSDGSYVRFDPGTADTAVYIDGRYLGSDSGSVYFVPSGVHEFSFSVLGEDAGSLSIDIPHHIFFTLFMKRVDTISIEIENNEAIERAVIENGAREAAIWSRITDYPEGYHYPPVFTDFAVNAVSLGFEDVSDPFSYMALHIVSDEMEKDFRNALTILEGSDVEYRSKTLDEIIAILDGSVPPSPEKMPIAVTSEYSNGFFSYEPLSFVMGSSDSAVYPESNERYAYVETDAFSIASVPVSEYDYALFVSENPYWAESNKEKLIEDGMVDENYLVDVNLSVSVHSMLPVKSISWYAADAYCRWLSGKTGMNIVLPTEAEWTAAAISAQHKGYTSSLLSIDNDTSAPSAMMGQLWELTSSSYIPLSRFALDEAERLEALYPYDDIIVKGGSWINTPDRISIDTVGAMDRSACSLYAGFRVGVR